MGILVNTGFDVGSSDPVDSRTVKETTDERDALVTDGLVYENLKVYCKDTQIEYRWTGTDWEEVGTGETVDPSIFQKINDDTLTTDDKTVVGAINELDSNKIDRPAVDGTAGQILVLQDDGSLAYQDNVSEFDDTALQEAMANKIDKPAVDGTAGQILVLQDDGSLAYEDNVGSDTTDLTNVRKVFCDLNELNNAKGTNISLVVGEDNTEKIMNVLEPNEEFINWFNNENTYNRFGIDLSMGNRLNSISIQKYHDNNGIVIAITNNGKVLSRYMRNNILSNWDYDKTDLTKINNKLAELENNQINKSYVNRLGVSGRGIIKISPNGANTFSKILITDTYGVCILITGAKNGDSSVKSFKVVKISNGSWTTNSPSVTTPNKLININYDGSYIYLTVDSYSSFYFEGGFSSVETITSLPTGATELPILDLTQAASKRVYNSLEELNTAKGLSLSFTNGEDNTMKIVDALSPIETFADYFSNGLNDNRFGINTNTYGTNISLLTITKFNDNITIIRAFMVNGKLLVRRHVNGVLEDWQYDKTDLTEINTKLSQLETKQLNKTSIVDMNPTPVCYKITPKDNNTFSKILIVDLYGGCLLITGSIMPDYKSLKAVRLSNGCWESYSASNNVANKIESVYYDGSYIYVNCLNYIKINFEGGFTNIEKIDSMPTEATELPILDLTQQTDLTGINTKLTQLETKANLIPVAADNPTDYDLNNYKENGNYSIGDSSKYSNAPISRPGLLTVIRSNSYRLQIYTVVNNDDVYFRKSTDWGKTWTSWVLLNDSTDLTDINDRLTQLENTTGGGNTNNDVYTTEEQAVGTWINGKTLYRRTIEDNTLRETGTDMIKLFNYSTNMKIVKYEGVVTLANNNGNTHILSLPYSKDGEEVYVTKTTLDTLRLDSYLKNFKLGGYIVSVYYYKV